MTTRSTIYLTTILDFFGISLIMASTITLFSPLAATLSVIKGPTKVLDNVSPRKVPYGGDIHKLRDDFDSGLEKECRSEDARIRGFPAWSSPIANPTAAKVRFKYRANGHYLEFLSLFLTGERQVDISFSRRHALIIFLLNSLEECHYQFARRRVPGELEMMQMISSDEMELQVWQAFIRADLTLGVMDYATDEDGETYRFFKSVDRIRQLAVHRSSTYRWNFDTRIIQSAAACAQHLGDGALVEKIELLVKVLYMDAGGESEYAVTEDERIRAYDLLWPSNRQPETIHQFLDKLQNLAEKSSYNFCQKRLPQELVGYECTTAEHFELSQWRRIIMYRSHSTNTTEDNGSFAELDGKLQKADVSDLRNAASHRQSLVLYPAYGFYDDTPKVEAYIDTAKAYVRALGDEETALEMETLEREVLPALHKKYDNDWLNPQWCANRDLESIDRMLRKRRSQWDKLHRHIWDTWEVNINPILSVYGRAETRLYLLKGKLGLNGPTAEPSEDDVAQQTPCESAVESPSDRRPRPSLAELHSCWDSKPTETPSYGEDSLSAIACGTEHKQQDFKTTTSSDRGSDVSGDDTTSWGGGNDGRWDDEHHATTSAAAADSSGEDNEPDTETDYWDTDDSATEVTDETECTNDAEESGWWCPDEAADRGIAVGGWEDA
ncbi:MAG: hypothetical protein LQ349_007442 [Xanthoria aureola]|nr:MAG: hypothetical protein LQ349_007442 [Xanthoria aureola]